MVTIGSKKVTTITFTHNLYWQILSLIISPGLISIVYSLRFGKVLLLNAFSLFLTREKILWSTL